MNYLVYMFSLMTPTIQTLNKKNNTRSLSAYRRAFAMLACVSVNTANVLCKYNLVIKKHTHTNTQRIHTIESQLEFLPELYGNVYGRARVCHIDTRACTYAITYTGARFHTLKALFQP